MDFQMVKKKELDNLEISNDKTLHQSTLDGGRTAAWWWDLWNRLSRELRLAIEKAWCLRQSLSQCLIDVFAGIFTDVWHKVL